MSNFFNTHEGFAFRQMGWVSVVNLRLGDVVNFDYKKDQRYVMVVAPNFDGKLHGIDLDTISRRDFLRYLYPNVQNFKDPKNFYDVVIKDNPVLLDAKCYKTFFVDEIRRLYSMKYKV